jgi:hypothetical protein
VTPVTLRTDGGFDASALPPARHFAHAPEIALVDPG